ncbi:MAG TPA: AraC family transcriptional regulator [Pseudobacter sp.]|nr:AraC family transcriptional regulator [Pseudobacter sp.]
MKPVRTTIPESINSEVFAVRVTALPFFSSEFHFHEECQLVYVIQSQGKRIIGDSIEPFASDEVVLLGPQIPHVWYNDKHYFEHQASEIHARSIALFFNEEKILRELSMFAPVHKLEAVLQKARRGMKFEGQTKEMLKELLLQISMKEGLDRVITLLNIFKILDQSVEYQLLASEGYTNKYLSNDKERIDKVFHYIFENFRQDISLNDVAAIANMNRQAFCRYFKSRTQKTFVEFLNEVRISHACRLLTESNQAVANLAYDCGFNSITNFNRIFKEIKGISPRQFRNMLE